MHVLIKSQNILVRFRPILLLKKTLKFYYYKHNAIKVTEWEKVRCHCFSILLFSYIYTIFIIILQTIIIYTLIDNIDIIQIEM